MIIKILAVLGKVLLCLLALVLWIVIIPRSFWVEYTPRDKVCLWVRLIFFKVKIYPLPKLPSFKKEEKKPEVENQFVYTNLEEQMKSLIGTKVSVRAKANGKGKIEIEYYSPDDLERIYELLMTIQHN